MDMGHSPTKGTYNSGVNALPSEDSDTFWKLLAPSLRDSWKSGDIMLHWIIKKIMGSQWKSGFICRSWSWTNTWYLYLYMFFGVPGVWLALSDILMLRLDTVENLKSPHLVAVTTYHVLFIFILKCLGISLVFWDSPFDLIFSDTEWWASLSITTQRVDSLPLKSIRISSVQWQWHK